ncbi:MAG: hypothetical protein LKG27_02415 [Clostridiaceae bacterium]|jgi:plasmid maintenance system killer protein|nr:hypothetical protein [Clostridiaceae bacterium]
MELIFESTTLFERELKKIQQKQDFIKQINRLFELLKSNNTNINNLKLTKCKLKLPQELEPSLYTWKINKDYRLILSIDDDPLFERQIITLYAITKPDSYNKVFSSITESLYQQYNEVSHD